MSFFIAEAAAQAQASAPATPNAGFLNIALLGGLFLFMYFMIIRPQRKRQKDHQSLVNSLNKGDEVVMSSGLIGKIPEVDEAYVTIKASDNVELKCQKASVHAVLPKGTIKAL